MFDRPIDLGQARILLTNDDGIEARGLKVLHKVVRGLCRDVWIVAPEIEQSGASHSLTLHRPLRVRKLGPRRVAQSWPKNTLINVNFPDLPASEVKGISVARQGRHKIGDQFIERTDPRGRPYYWIGPLRETGDGVAGTDIME